jgi:hypothetical protein
VTALPEVTDTSRYEDILAGLSALRYNDADGPDGRFRVPPADADPPAVNAVLIDVRRRLDLAEPLLHELMRRRTAARAAAKRTGGAADDAYDDKLASLAKTAVRREYESGRDRQASAAVDTSSLRRKARQADIAADVAEAALAEGRSMFYGLRDIREELLVRLRNYLPWLALSET